MAIVAESCARQSPFVNRLVVRAPNWLGDAVMALPAMGAIRTAFPDARIAIAAIGRWRRYSRS